MYTTRGFVVATRERLTCEEFEGLRVCDPRSGGTPYERYRLKVGGRWHVVDRQYQFGQPVYFARPITVVLRAA